MVKAKRTGTLVTSMVGLGEHNQQRRSMCDARIFGITLAACAPLALLCCVVCFTACERGRKESSPEDSCERNLQLVAKGIAGYRNAHGDLPQFLVGAKGDKHSWRTLVIPYIFPERSATSYHFDQPWDSSDNRKALWPGFLELFVHRCPLDPSPGPSLTSYLMLVRAPVKDSETGEMKTPPLASDAVLVVESVDSGVQFAEPRDLPWDDLWKGDSPFGKGKLNSLHPKVVKALRVDGKVIDIPKDITKEDLRKLLAGTATK